MKSSTLLGSAAVVLMNWVQPAPAPAIIAPLATIAAASIGTGAVSQGIFEGLTALNENIQNSKRGVNHYGSNNQNQYGNTGGGGRSTENAPAVPSPPVEFVWNEDGSCDMYNLPEIAKSMIYWYHNHPDYHVLESLYGKVQWTGDSSARFWDYHPHERELIAAKTEPDGTLRPW